jgi:tetratricopeptide (TPR) repeat protein
MTNQDKILELLQKEKLSEEEKLLLERFSVEDAEAAKFINAYKKLNNVIRVSSHLSYDDIGDYILFKNNFAPENKNVIKVISRIEEHLRTCSKCTEDFKILNEDFNNIETFVGTEFSKAKNIESSAKEIFQKKKSRYSRYVIFTILAIGILYGILFTVSKVTTPVDYELASVNTGTEFYSTRGRATGDFLKSLNALEKGNIDEAINCLKDDIKNHPDDKTIFYSYYILGLTYLHNTDRSFIGLFPHYSVFDAEQAAKSFQNVIRKNNSGNYKNINLDACFYLAKAKIMMGNKKAAKKDLTMVINEKGSKMDEAKYILSKLR